MAVGDKTCEADRLTGNLIDNLVADCRPIVRSREMVHVALYESTKLEQVIAFHPGEIVANHLILAIPVSLSHALSIHVIRNQRASSAGFGIRVGGRSNLDCTAQACKLGSNAGRAPLPPVPEVTHPQVVSHGWA